MITNDKLFITLMDRIGKLSRVQTHKLPFLFHMENDLEPVDFEAYHYGPFNKKLVDFQDDYPDLFENHYSSMPDGRKIAFTTLTEEGETKAEKFWKTYTGEEKKSIRKFIKQYRFYTPSDLAHYVYGKYPQWRGE